MQFFPVPNSQNCEDTGNYDYASRAWRFRPGHSHRLLLRNNEYHTFFQRSHVGQLLGFSIGYSPKSGDTYTIKGVTNRCNNKLLALLIEVAWMDIRKNE